MLLSSILLMEKAQTSFLLFAKKMLLGVNEAISVCTELRGNPRDPEYKIKTFLLLVR